MLLPMLPVQLLPPALNMPLLRPVLPNTSIPMMQGSAPVPYIEQATQTPLKYHCSGTPGSRDQSTSTMSLEVDGKAGEGSQEPLVLSQQSAASYHTVDFTELGVVAVDGFVFAKESSQSQDAEHVERSESIEVTPYRGPPSLSAHPSTPLKSTRLSDFVQRSDSIINSNLPTAPHDSQLVLSVKKRRRTFPLQSTHSRPVSPSKQHATGRREVESLATSHERPCKRRLEFRKEPMERHVRYTELKVMYSLVLNQFFVN